MTQDIALFQKETGEILKTIGIPPCPSILTKLLAEMRADEADFRRIQGLIQGDVGLAAGMLKTVNSPFYGLQSKATSIQQALHLLGSRNVVQLATGLLLNQAFSAAKNPAITRFLGTSGEVALMTAHIARGLRICDRDEAYTFGLFRDCGVLVLMEKFKDYPKTLTLASVSTASPSTQVEEQHHNTHHGVIGHALAESWYLTPELCSAVRWHHDYDALQNGSVDLSPKSRKLIALALAADLMNSVEQGNPVCLEWDKGEAFVYATLGVPPEQLHELTKWPGR